jgi:1-acylglycerone phosphate reductase
MAQKKTVLVTGCSDGGLGSALALSFHAKGFHIYASARDLSTTTALSSLSNITLLKLDVTSDSDVAAAAEFVKHDNGGKLDIVVNNAGRNYFMPVLDTDIDAAKKIFDTNFWGALRIMKAFAPLLVKSQGVLVSIASISGYVNVPWMGMSLSPRLKFRYS